MYLDSMYRYGLRPLARSRPISTTCITCCHRMCRYR
jgi:hypothetical protein